MKREFEKVWVKAAPLSDPQLAGKEQVRRPGNPNKVYTAEPQEVEKDTTIIRMIALGDLVETDKPRRASRPVAPDVKNVKDK